MSRDVVVILHGNMMPEQQRRAHEKNKMHVQHVLTVLEWLVENNKEWKLRNMLT